MKKYNIKQSGNTIKRVAFNFGNDTEQQMNNKPLTAILDSSFFN